MEPTEADALNSEIRACVCDHAKKSGFAGDVAIEVTPFTSFGDNYLGVVYGVRASGSDAEWNPKKLRFALKRMPKSEPMKEAFRIAVAFSNEVRFYSETLPAFKDFQEKHGRNGEDYLSYIPKCYGTSSDGINDFILMEDLRESGFTMGERREGLDAERCRLVMRSVGKFHAFSYAMKEKDPEKFGKLSKDLQNPFFDPEIREKNRETFQKIATYAVEAVRVNSPELAKRLESWVSQGYYDNLTELFTAKDEHSVIGHGDLWTNNVLFRGVPPTQVRFLDYQLMLHTSPAADLLYMLYTSVSKDVRYAHYERFLGEYHEALRDTLIHLGANPDVLPMNVLKEKVKKHAMFGLGMAMYLIPVFYGEITEEIRFLNEGDIMMILAWNNSVYAKQEKVQFLLAETVAEFVERGWFKY